MAAVREDHNYFRLPDIYDVPHHGNGTPNEEMDAIGGRERVSMETHMSVNDVEVRRQFLPVVVRDVVGRPLDINTTYQRAIYEAKWKFSQGELPQKAEEWRLPHAPLPARPDYTRTAPPLAMQHIYKKELKRAHKVAQSYPEFSDTIDSDRGFQNLRWSLQQAETLPPLAGAQLINKNSCRVPPKTYLPFVGAAPAAKRIFLETDVREAEYEFPGFCSGCTKGTGLCYGCERDSKPHFHRDKVARTGGGFVYLKHDKAYGVIASKNPANWNVAIPETERTRLERYLYPQQPEQHGHRQWLPGPPKSLPPTAYVFYDDVVHPDFEKYGHKVSVVRLRDSTDERFVEEVGLPYDPEHPDTASRIATYLTDTGYDDISTRAATVPEAGAAEEQNEVIRVETGCVPSMLSYDQRLSTLSEDTTAAAGATETPEKSRESTKTTTGSDVSSHSKSRSLYKTPSPFKLKSAEKQVTIPVDPFSKDRQYNIPTGGGIEIKKSDKPLTEFDEFNFGEGNWQEPTFQNRGRTDVTPVERSRPSTKVSLDRKSKSDVTESEQSYKPSAPPPPPPTGEIKTESKPSEEEEKYEEEQPVIVEEAPKSMSPDSGNHSEQGDRLSPVSEDSPLPDTAIKYPSAVSSSGYSRRTGSVQPNGHSSTTSSSGTANSVHSYHPGTEVSDPNGVQSRCGTSQKSANSTRGTVSNRRDSVQSHSSVADATDRAIVQSRPESTAEYRSGMFRRSSFERERRCSGQDEGISLGPIVHQLDTPQVEEKRRDAIVRPPVQSAVSRRSSVTLSVQSSVHSAVHSAASVRSQNGVPTRRRTSLELDKATSKPGSRISSSHHSIKTTIRSPSPIAASAEIDNGGDVDVRTVESVPAPPVTREHSISEATLTEPDVIEQQEDKASVPDLTETTSSSLRTVSPVTDSDATTPSPPKREKRPRPPIVKRERKQREPPVRRSRAGSMKDVIEEEPETVKEKPPTPEPERAEKPPEPEPESEPESEPSVAPIVFKEHSLPTPPPMRRVAPPPLPRAAPPVPPIPREYTDVEKPKREVSQTLIEAPPPMYEPPKQKKPPPIKRPKAKSKERRLPVIRPSEVRKEQPEIKRIVDPLDYLAKYCIIHKDRLPHYERIFNKVIKEQQYRYADVPHEEDSQGNDVPAEGEAISAGQPIKTRLTDHEEKMINDFILINRSTREEYAMVGYNIGDQNVQKVNFTLDTLINKYEELQEKHDKLQADRILMIADFAKKMFPEVLHPNYKGEKKKKKKRSKKNKAIGEGQAAGQKTDDASGRTVDGTGRTAEAGVQTEIEADKEPRRLTEIDIVRRLTPKMLDEISKQPDIARINLEIERLQEKLRDVDDRIEDLEDEKKLLQLYSRDVYLRDITQNKRELTFLRRQSALYQKMHPNQDPEMNLSELEDALQQINGHLISEKELQFIYHILDLKSRRRINLQLFCVVAALSEKVKQVDPFVRKLINKFNYEALNVKMDKSKELFWLLDGDSDEVPSGKITATSLAVELAAGGVSPEHTQFVVNKFNRECKGTVDFLDYLTYVPLFIELHGRIVEDPLSSKRVY